MSSFPPFPHLAIFPFMSKGHTIPLIHLAHLIRHRRLATITFITTPRNSPFIHHSLGDIEADIVEIPFPDRVERLSIRVESTDQLSSISLFLPFVAITKQLDSWVAKNKPILYVTFGSYTDVSEKQLREIAIGLERSGLDFLLVVRAKGLEPKVIQDRGRIVREWVDQLGILRHESIKGFMSHCGWNLVMESICAGVPILAWPMMAEQPLNAKLIVDELGIRLKIQASDGTKYGLVKHGDIEKLTKELPLGDGGRMTMHKVKQLALLAENAMIGGGSSTKALEEMINEFYNRRITLKNGHKI